MGNRILIIEDDTAISQVLQLNLECADYIVTTFDNGLTAWNALEANHDYDLALLDMMLPGIDGFALLPKLQEYGIPVICLTAMGDAQHEVQGLRGGAEDYIAKPFDMLALMVRMEKVLKRSGKLNEVYHFRDLTLDNSNRRLHRNGEEINLPPLEFDVLAVLMKNKNRTVSRERILNEIWGQDYFGDIRTVDGYPASLAGNHGQKAFDAPVHENECKAFHSIRPGTFGSGSDAHQRDLRKIRRFPKRILQHRYPLHGQ